MQVSDGTKDRIQANFAVGLGCQAVSPKLYSGFLCYSKFGLGENSKNTSGENVALLSKPGGGSLRRFDTDKMGGVNGHRASACLLQAGRSMDSVCKTP